MSRQNTCRKIGAAALVSVAVTVFMTPVASAAEAAPGGKSSDDAAASCWEIKQNNPSAADGTYWLQTPKLVAPEQFYCDMTTDGGGWVLIGRGREGWRPEYTGLGTTAQVRENVTGTAAFTPRQLDSRVIDGLLNGNRVDGLDDGIRLKRAANTAGTQWQESRLKMAKRDRWTWATAAEHPISSWQIGSRTGNNAKLPAFGDNGANHVDTRSLKEQKWTFGWAYGSGSRGTPDASSYIYSATATTGYPRPFTQMFVRPKLTQNNLNYGTVADGGTAKSEQSPLLQSGVEPQEWGVTGRATNNANEHFTETQTVSQVGDTVFVGGNFRYVQKGENGEQIDQSYLAGFDVHSGQPVRGFAPKFNGQVKALAALPNGKLVAAGEFTQVNGQPHAGLVALNPATGAIDSSWQVKVENRRSGGKVAVWDLEVQGNQLYLGGNFTHLTGINQGWAVYASNAARASTTTAAVDHKWNPLINGTVYDLDVTGDRFYATGWIVSVQNTEVKRVAVVSTAEGAARIPNLRDPIFSAPANYQQAIQAAGDRVWLGGSQHSMFSYSPSIFALLSGSITKAGGDLQSIDVVDGQVYGQCHCGDFTYQDAYTYPDVGSNWTQADNIRFIGAWNPSTGAYQPEFTPWINSVRGQGGWGAFVDSTGTAWFAGDFNSGRLDNGWQWTWLGGFARFKPRDVAAPSTPSNLKSTTSGNSLNFTWTGSTDARGKVRYELLRDDRVIASSTTAKVTVPNKAGKYFVRAADPANNRSASTSAVQIAS